MKNQKNKTIRYIGVLALIVSLLASCTTGQTKKKIDLPKDANSFIQNELENKTIWGITETKTMMDYEVIMTDGTEVEFNHQGEWEDINFRKTVMPMTFLASLPQPMKTYIEENNLIEEVHKIEKKRLGRKSFVYCVELHKPNDIELSFTKEGELISDDPEGKRLPSAARSFLNNHFSKLGVSAIVEDVDGSYNVTLEDETEISFSRKGVWYELRVSKRNCIPASLMEQLPSNIEKYVKTYHEKQCIRRIEKKSYGYRVKMSKPNNVELQFSKNGEFLGGEDKNATDEE